MNISIRQQVQQAAKGRDCRGAVLIIVMWIAFGLVSVSLFFGHAMNFEYRGAKQIAAGYQSEQAISGALRYFLFVLGNEEEAGTIPDPTTFSSQYFQVGESTVYLIGRGDGTDIGINEPAFGVIDESSKININLAPYSVLELLPTITPEFAAAIIDWRDEDDEVTENGAEAGSYGLMEPAYEIKNAPFETLEELRMVYGATTEMLYGEDINRNGILDPNENDGADSPPLDDSDGVLDFGIIEYLTVYAEEPEEEENEDQEENPGGGGNEQPNQGGGAARLQQQPGGDNNDDDDTPSFKVNINTASAVVLSCLPGIDLSTAEQIVAARIGNEDPNASMDWVNDVVDASVLSEAQEFLTDKAYQFTLDAAAVGKNGHGYRRVRFVIDNISGTPVIRHRKDMNRYGWALGETIRQEFNSGSTNNL